MSRARTGNKSNATATTNTMFATATSNPLTESHAEIDDWIRRVMPDLHPVVDWLDKTVRKTIPGFTTR